MEDIDFDTSEANWTIGLFPLWNNLYGYYDLDTKKCSLNHIHNWECRMMEQILKSED